MADLTALKQNIKRKNTIFIENPVYALTSKVNGANKRVVVSGATRGLFGSWWHNKRGSS